MLLKIRIAVEKDYKYLIHLKLEVRGLPDISSANLTVKKDQSIHLCWVRFPASTHGIIIKTPQCPYFQFKK